MASTLFGELKKNKRNGELVRYVGPDFVPADDLLRLQRVGSASHYRTQRDAALPRYPVCVIWSHVCGRSAGEADPIRVCVCGAVQTCTRAIRPARLAVREGLVAGECPFPAEPPYEGLCLPMKSSSSTAKKARNGG
jgi:hypothetical protein